MNRDSAIESLKRVESEFEASRFALARAMTQAQRDPTILHGQPLTAEHLRRALVSSEVTFIVRIFAQFEGTVRDYWATRRKTEPRTADLLKGVATYRTMPMALLGGVQAVRICRNDITHKGEVTAVVPFGECRSRLCQFIAQLPRQW